MDGFGRWFWNMQKHQVCLIDLSISTLSKAVLKDVWHDPIGWSLRFQQVTHKRDLGDKLHRWWQGPDDVAWNGKLLAWTPVDSHLSIRRHFQNTQNQDLLENNIESWLSDSGMKWKTSTNAYYCNSLFMTMSMPCALGTISSVLEMS